MRGGRDALLVPDDVTVVLAQIRYAAPPSEPEMRDEHCEVGDGGDRSDEQDGANTHGFEEIRHRRHLPRLRL